MLFLDRFFKPRWQHAKPEVRKQALLALSPQNPEDMKILLRLAEHDVDPDVRRSAVKRVSDLAFLRRRTNEDNDAGVREVASARYRQLLAGGAEGADINVRLAELALCDDESVLAFVARRGREPELRIAALNRLDAEAVLEDAALNDDAARVRLAAVQRLRAPATLERVSRLARDKDRKVAKLAREALEELQRRQAAEEQARAQRVALCEEMEALAEAPWRHGYNGEKLRLENRWQAVPLAADEALAARFEAARRRVEQRIQEQANRPEPEPVVVETPSAPQAAPDVNAWLDELQAQPEPDPARLATLEQRLAEAVAAEPADANEAAAYRQALRVLRGYVEAAQRYLAHEGELAEALNAAHTADVNDDAALRAAAQDLRRVLERTAWDLPLPLPALLGQAAAELDAVEEQRERLNAQRAQQLAKLEETLAALDQQLGGGHLKEAQRLLARAQRALEQLPARDQERLERRLKKYAGRVRELQDWRRFATLPKQEELCRRMEALIDVDLEPPVRAERIRALQEEWKATGGSASPEAQRLWERFRQAADKAFEPCKAYFEEQARFKQLNLEQRERISAQLEQFMASADWDRLELAALEAIRAQARKEWVAAAPVDRRAGQAVEERFEGMMAALTERIRAKQDVIRQRKEALVEQARALTTLEDFRAAAQQAKELQAQWKAAGTAPAGVERRLWKEFRAACDRVFERRDELRNLQEQERQASVARAQALCEEAEALLGRLDETTEALRERLQALRQALDGLDALPRDAARSFGARLDRVEQALSARDRDQELQRWREEFANVERRAALCARLEERVLTAPAEARALVEAAQQQWQELPPAPAELRPALQARWERLVAAADAGFGAEELAHNRARRHELCVRAEILAGVDSPPEDRGLRMDLQVRRLAQGMAEGVRERPEVEARRLRLEWLTVGPAAPEDQAWLERRFQAALAALGS